jgi:hypothetical protein
MEDCCCIIIVCKSTMKQKSVTQASSSDRFLKHIRIMAWKQHSPEEMTMIVQESLRAEHHFAELWRSEGIANGSLWLIMRPQAVSF